MLVIALMLGACEAAYAVVAPEGKLLRPWPECASCSRTKSSSPSMRSANNTSGQRALAAPVKGDAGPARPPGCHLGGASISAGPEAAETGDKAVEEV